MKTKLLAAGVVCAVAIGVVTAGANTPILTTDGGQLPEPNEIVTTRRFSPSATELAWAAAQATREPAVRSLTKDQVLVVDKVVPWALSSSDIEDPVGLAVLVRWDTAVDAPLGHFLNAEPTGTFSPNGRPKYVVRRVDQSATGMKSMWLFYDRTTRELARSMPLSAAQITATPSDQPFAPEDH